ncbi:LiaI-LiaF-like domain-containing protein [Reichenbachiella sp.]|uniref:LiaI-LiaF-like domain-containing protein n=1 Tax=Reichenbachiella sp. TaxID=2184521 RepID=UPI003BAFF2AF
MSQRTSQKTPSSNSRSGILGIILIALGGLFLLDNLDLIPYEISYYLFNWKGIMIMIGALFLSSKENKTPGIILMAVGGFFIMSDVLSYEFDWHWYDTRKLFWPVLLIVIGLVILSRKSKSPIVSAHVFTVGDEDLNAETGEKTVPNDSDHINVTAVLGGGDMSITSDNFQGGKVTTVMGGGTYDLSNCKLADGTQEIDILILMGGANFIVPADWNVRLEVTSIFGGYSDCRKSTSDVKTDTTKELLIKGTVLFGGGEVKNYV